MKEHDKSKVHSIGYKVGYIAAIVIVACVVILAVALTVKFLSILF